MLDLFKGEEHGWPWGKSLKGRCTSRKLLAYLLFLKIKLSALEVMINFVGIEGHFTPKRSRTPLARILLF